MNKIVMMMMKIDKEEASQNSYENSKIKRAKAKKE